MICMNTEIGQPCIQIDLNVLLFASSSKRCCGSDEHVPFLDVNFTPSFAKFPTLNRADARKSGKNNKVKPQKINCMFSSVDGSPFFHVSSEHPKMDKLK